MTREDDIEECERLLAKLAKARDKASRKAREHQGRAAELSTEIARAQTVLERLRIPAEPSDGAIIRFIKRFPGNPKTYVYTAHRENELWWASGRYGPDGVHWPRLVQFIRDRNTAPFGFEIVTSQPTTLSKLQPPF